MKAKKLANLKRERRGSGEGRSLPPQRKRW
jgi:hypothetical protein